jgi:uncharacterized protein GlcG (DUF336 family)
MHRYVKRPEEEVMMKRIHGVLLLLVVLAFTATAAAQNVPAQFVITGDTAKRIHDYTTINFATAKRIAETCEDLARKEGVAVSIYILDNDGNHVYMDRMDGQGYLNIVTAEMKARSALMAREPSKNRMNRVQQNPEIELQQIKLGFFPNSGGLPIIVNDQMIGAIGVGGSAPRVAQGWSDEICAHKALTAVIGPQPPLLEDLPRKAANQKVPVPAFDLPQGKTPHCALPPEYVVSGKAAVNIFDGNQVSSAAAKKIAQTCLEYATAHGGGASVYVMDTHGTLVHQERSDGQIYNNMHATLLKTETALQTRRPTSIVLAQLQNDPSGLARQWVQFEFTPIAGGIPIVVDGDMIGAVGAGGTPGGNDETCAVEGLKAAFGNRALLPVYPQK